AERRVRSPLDTLCASVAQKPSAPSSDLDGDTQPGNVQERAAEYAASPGVSLMMEEPIASADDAPNRAGRLGARDLAQKATKGTNGFSGFQGSRARSAISA